MKAHSINGSTLVQIIWIGVERNHTVLLIIPIFSNLSNYFYREYIFKKYVFYKKIEPQQGEFYLRNSFHCWGLFHYRVASKVILPKSVDTWIGKVPSPKVLTVLTLAPLRSTSISFPVILPNLVLAVNVT